MALRKLLCLLLVNLLVLMMLSLILLLLVDLFLVLVWLLLISDLEFLPPNTEGELIVYEDSSSIKNIAKGYLKLPAQTENKFVSVYNPVLNTVVKAYRTGDIVKLSTDGEIEFVGRDDDVVKVNGGYLVALNEVEKKIQSLLGNDFDTYPIAIPFKNTKVIILFVVSNESNISMYSVRNYINNNISFLYET